MLIEQELFAVVEQLRLQVLELNVGDIIDHMVLSL